MFQNWTVLIRVLLFPVAFQRSSEDSIIANTSTKCHRSSCFMSVKPFESSHLLLHQLLRHSCLLLLTFGTEDERRFTASNLSSFVSKRRSSRHFDGWPHVSKPWQWCMFRVTMTCHAIPHESLCLRALVCVDRMTSALQTLVFLMFHGDCEVFAVHFEASDSSVKTQKLLQA